MSYIRFIVIDSYLLENICKNYLNCIQLISIIIHYGLSNKFQILYYSRIKYCRNAVPKVNKTTNNNKKKMRKNVQHFNFELYFYSFKFLFKKKKKKNTTYLYILDQSGQRHDVHCLLGRGPWVIAKQLQYLLLFSGQWLVFMVYLSKCMVYLSKRWPW